MDLTAHLLDEIVDPHPDLSGLINLFQTYLPGSKFSLIQEVESKLEDFLWK